jgi:20S proteasome subunit beta 6
VLAGLSSNQDSGGGGGQVYTYDAIGSYEQVAIATAGSGRELLQPILDRKFSSLEGHEKDNLHDERATTAEVMQLQRTERTELVSKSVSCGHETAVKILVDAFRDVSAREIAVGDQIVLCILQRSRGAMCESRVLTFNLS